MIDNKFKVTVLVAKVDKTYVLEDVLITEEDYHHENMEERACLEVLYSEKYKDDSNVDTVLFYSKND